MREQYSEHRRPMAESFRLRLRSAATALLAALSCIPAAAVYLDSGNSGQALIYPYFTAQAIDGNPFNTYVSVANQAMDAKVLRVRFREGRNGRELAVFNLYLGALDTWTAAVIPTEMGARLLTRDNSCVAGAFSSDGTSRYLDFGNASFSGTASDGLGASADRLREGYLEIIELATLVGSSASDATPPAEGGEMPSNCAALSGENPSVQTAAPTGGLAGTLTLINVSKGMDFTVNAVALSDLTSQSIYRGYSDPYPDFNSLEVSPVAFMSINDKSYRAVFASGVEAVSAVLTAASANNETILDSATRSGTNWVATLPMRRFQRPALASPPTGYPPNPDDGLPVSLNWRARDGAAMAFIDNCGFLCPPRTYEVHPRLPWATTVIDFARGTSAAWAPETSSRVLGSANAVKVTLPTSSESGSGQLSFLGLTSDPFQAAIMNSRADAVLAASGRLVGTPVVGFMLRTFENDQLDCAGSICQGNYGGSFPHSLTRQVQP